MVTVLVVRFLDRESSEEYNKTFHLSANHYILASTFTNM